MVYKVIACKVLSREISTLIPRNPNFIDVTYLRQGLHDTPDKLRQVVQEKIDDIEEDRDMNSLSWGAEGKRIDAIILVYGLCSNGIQGVRSKRYPIVVPRAHDCITLLLGSKERYTQYYNELGGRAYWYTPGWIENTSMPSEERFQFLKEKYLRDFGEENAEYLLETELGWQKNYEHIAYVSWDNILQEGFTDFAKSCADYFQWQYHNFHGDDVLLHDLLHGNWDEERFLVVPPGEVIEPSYDDGIVTRKACEEQK